MYLDRFFKHIAAAIAIAPKCDVSLVALLLLLMLELNAGVLNAGMQKELNAGVAPSL